MNGVVDSKLDKEGRAFWNRAVLSSLFGAGVSGLNEGGTKACVANLRAG